MTQPTPPTPPTPPPIPFATPVGPAPAPALATPRGGGGPGLSPEHIRQIADARKRQAKIRKGAAVAVFDGWATAIFGGLTLLGGLFSPVGLALGAGMLVVAFIEFRGANRLKHLDLEAPKLLAWNQVILGTLLFAYAVFSLWRIYTGRTEIATQLAAYPELSQYAIDVEELTKTIGLLVYGTLMAVAVFGQGGTALFYLSRRKHVEAYLRETPQWIVDAQRAGLPM